MRNKKYDFFNGGLAELGKDLINLRDKQLNEIRNKALKKIADEVKKNITLQGQTVVGGYHEKSAVMNDNVIQQLSDTQIKIINLSQFATYSEFGTGSVGFYNGPHPNEIPTWDFMINDNRNYAIGWWYKAPNGLLVHTYGVPSNPVFYRSSRLVKNDLKNILGTISKEVIK